MVLLIGQSFSLQRIRYEPALVPYREAPERCGGRCIRRAAGPQEAMDSETVDSFRHRGKPVRQSRPLGDLGADPRNVCDLHVLVPAASALDAGNQELKARD